MKKHSHTPILHKSSIINRQSKIINQTHKSLPLFARSTLWNLSGTVLPLAVGLLLIPATLRALGDEAFGILTLLWAAIGYFSLFDFGLGRALTQLIASKRSEGTPLMGSLLFTGILGTLLPGIVGGLALWFLTPWLVYDALKISAQLQPQALEAFQWAACSIPLVTLASGLRGVLEGFEDFQRAAYVRSLLGLLNFIGPWFLAVYAQAGLSDVAVALLLARLLSLVQNSWYIRRFTWQCDGLLFDAHLWKKLLGFGSWMTLSNLVGPLMVTADRYLLAAWLGAEVVAFYTVPQDLVVRMLLIPVAISTTLFPRISGYWQAQQADEMKALLAKSNRLLAIGMGAIVLALLLSMQPALTWWLGDAFASKAWLPASILLAGIFFNSMGLIPLTALQAAGRVKQTAILHLVELVFYVPALWWGVKLGGLAGAAVVWSLRTAVDWLVLQYLLTRTYRHQMQKAS